MSLIWSNKELDLDLNLSLFRATIITMATVNLDFGNSMQCIVRCCGTIIAVQNRVQE